MTTTIKNLVLSSAIGIAMLAPRITRADSYVNLNTYLDGVRTGTSETGNQVYFTGGNASVSVTNFSLQFYGTFTTGDTIEIRFYGTTGSAQNGYAYTPGPPLFDSGPLDLSSINGTTPGARITLIADNNTTPGPGFNNNPGDLPIGGVTVPTEFIFTAQFAGPDATDNGLALYGPTPSDGGNHGVAWVFDAPGQAVGWSLLTNAPGDTSPPFNIGASIEATPEPSSFALLGLGGLAALTAFRFRAGRDPSVRQNQTR